MTSAQDAASAAGSGYAWCCSMGIEERGREREKK
jgi:hypothetical protein